MIDNITDALLAVNSADRVVENMVEDLLGRSDAQTSFEKKDVCAIAQQLNRLNQLNTISSNIVKASAEKDKALNRTF